jgi:hypothetical protein
MHKAKSGSRRYGVWIQIEDTLPWIELEETYRTKNEAVVAAKQKLNAIRIKVVGMFTSEHEGEVYVPLTKVKVSR